MTMYVVCFVAGVALSALAFISGLHNVSLFDHDHIFGGHAHGGAHLHGSGPAHGGSTHAQPHAHAHAPAPGKGAPHLHGGSSRMMAVLSWFNMAAMTAFLAWFGGAGIVLGQVTHWPAGLILGGSVGVGIAGGSVVNRFIQTLARDGHEVLPTSYAGLLARVTSPIRQGGTGEVVYTLNGTRTTSGARSDDGVAVAKGAEVIINRYEKGIAYVSTYDELTAITHESET